MRRLLVAVVLLAAAPAAAQMHEVTVDLGDGLAVTRLCPVGTSSRACWGWSPVGFSFGDHSELLPSARAFARSRGTGAIIAVFSRLSRRMRIGTYAASGGQPHLMRTVDGGESWTAVDWDWEAAPIAIAFDNLTPSGVAVGELGHVWSTSDGGEHWTDHGGSSSSRWVSAAIAGGEVVMVDGGGGVFRSHDGGFRRDLVVTDRTARLEQRDTDIIVHTETADYVVARGETVRRAPR